MISIGQIVFAQYFVNSARRATVRDQQMSNNVSWCVVFFSTYKQLGNPQWFF